MAIPKVDVTIGRKLRICIYSGNGGGKTHLAMTAPGKKLLVDNYGNVETCLKFPKQSYDVVKGPPTYSEYIKLLKDPEVLDYDVVIGDNLTGMNRDFVIEAKDSGQTGGHLAENPNQSDYGLASERLRLIVTEYYNLAIKNKIHVILLAHERLEHGDDDRIIGNPSVPGQVPAHIMSMFTELIYLTVDGNGDRTAHFQKRGSFPAASRLLDPSKPIKIKRLGAPEDPKNPTQDLAQMYKQFWGELKH